MSALILSDILRTSLVNSTSIKISELLTLLEASHGQIHFMVSRHSDE